MYKKLMSEHKICILVVDGSSVSREILSRILREELNNTEIISCKSGAEAMDLITRTNVDLVTTALLLADMDGLALSRKIRDTFQHPSIPVVVVSGDADSRLLREGFEAGVTDYFDKSNGYKAFGKFIQGFLQRNSGLMGNILFIEDSRTAAAVVLKMLEKNSLQVTHVRSAEIALGMIEKSLQTEPDSPVFDLVITDFYLEGAMTGGDLLHAIRAKYHLSQQELPVLVLTGSNDPKTQVEIFHAGGNDFVHKPIVEEILIARVRALLLIKHQFDALKKQAETMRWIAATDSLTGVRSKRYLVDNGEEFIRAPENQGVWAIIIDIDHFKSVNDNLGHITGDHVLAELGEFINNHFPDDMAVRFGGEEFCLLVKNCDRETILRRSEDLRQQVEDMKPAGLEISISLGVAGMDDHPGTSLTQLIALADKCLYFSKETGRNRVSIDGPNGPEPLPAPASPLSEA
ncbi:MAG TPA: response regulator [Gammaproteobacteria bacterium]|nr:response regulator [Gammaproteobacteria bacterium]